MLPTQRAPVPPLLSSSPYKKERKVPRPSYPKVEATGGLAKRNVECWQKYCKWLKGKIEEAPSSTNYDKSLLDLYDRKGLVEEMGEFYKKRFGEIKNLNPEGSTCSCSNWHRFLDVYAPKSSWDELVTLVATLSSLFNDEKIGRLALAKKAYQEKEFPRFWEQINALLANESLPFDSLLFSLEDLAAEIGDPFFLEQCAYSLGLERTLVYGHPLCRTTVQSRFFLYEELRMLDQVVDKEEGITQEQLNWLKDKYQAELYAHPDHLGTFVQFIQFLLRYDQFFDASQAIQWRIQEQREGESPLLSCLCMEWELASPSRSVDFFQRMIWLEQGCPSLFLERMHLSQSSFSSCFGSSMMNCEVYFPSCIDPMEKYLCLYQKAASQKNELECLRLRVAIEKEWSSCKGLARLIALKHKDRSIKEQIDILLRECTNPESPYQLFPLSLQHKAWFCDPSMRISSLLALPFLYDHLA